MQKAKRVSNEKRSDCGMDLAMGLAPAGLMHRQFNAITSVVLAFRQDDTEKTTSNS
jgi:hypothetical protein